MRRGSVTLFVLLLTAMPTTAVAAPVEIGPLVVDEVFLGGPGAGAFLNGLQWIEITNAGAEPVDLAGVRLVVGEQVPVNLSASAPLQAGGVFVLLVTEDAGLALAADAAEPLGFPLQVVLAPPLPEQPESLTLESDDGVLDWLPLGATVLAVDLPGAVFALDPAFLTPEGNNDPSHWCASVDKGSLLGLLVNGTPGDANTFCDNDGDGYSEADGDCADTNAAVGPGADEACDGLDNDCNGLTDDVAWLDGNTAPCLQAGVCFGTRPACVGGGWSCSYPEEYEVIEVSCDAVDNDCDGQTDEGLTNECGLCGALPNEVCDGLDNDCDGVVDDGVTPPAGVCPESTGVCAEASPVCGGLTGWRCDHGPAFEEVEALCDGVDNDCDGQTDEGFPLGKLCVVEVRECQATGVWSCSDDHHGVVCASAPVGVGSELCGDGVDNDCDGQTDEGFPVGDVCEVGTGTCRATGRYVCTNDDLGVLCDATPLQPGGEVCDDAQDNDCDGQTDETDCTFSEWSNDTNVEGGGVRCSAAFGAPATPALPWLLAFASALTLILSRPRERDG